MTESSAPAIIAESVPPRVGNSYPPPFDAASAGRKKRALGDAFGLTDYGVNLVTLPPGTASSQRHWHSAEDEFVYILSGHPTLVTDAGRTGLKPGMCAGFPANGGGWTPSSQRNRCRRQLSRGRQPAARRRCGILGHRHAHRRPGTRRRIRTQRRHALPVTDRGPVIWDWPLRLWHWLFAACHRVFALLGPRWRHRLVGLASAFWTHAARAAGISSRLGALGWTLCPLGELLDDTGSFRGPLSEQGREVRPHVARHRLGSGPDRGDRGTGWGGTVHDRRHLQ